MRSLAGFLEASAPGVVLDVDLLAPDVLLDRLGVLDHILAHADLFLDRRALAHDDLFLGHRHDDFLVSDLGLGGLARGGHALHADLLVAGGDLYLLAVGPHALANLELSGLALSGTGDELFLGPLHPQLVLVGQVRAIGRSRGLVGLLVVVALVGAALLGGSGAAEAVVGVDLVLELGRDLPVVVEGGAVLGLILVGVYGNGPARVVGGANGLPGDEGAPGPEEAHLHADVLGLVRLVDEEVVHLADLLTHPIVDRVAGEAILDRREPVRALFVLRHALTSMLVAWLSRNTQPTISPSRSAQTVPGRPRAKPWRCVLAHKDRVSTKNGPKCVVGQHSSPRPWQLHVRPYRYRDHRSAHARDKAPPLLGGVPLPALGRGDGCPPSRCTLRQPGGGQRASGRPRGARRMDAPGGGRTAAGLRALPGFGTRADPVGLGRRRGGWRHGARAPLDARAAPEGARAHPAVPGGARSGGGGGARQPGGGPEAGTHAGQPAPVHGR